MRALVMKKSQSKLCRVALEPRLEAIAGMLPARDRRELAREFKRWARQLDISASIMESDHRRAYEKRPTPPLKRLPLRVLLRN